MDYRELSTPALAIDLDVLERNLDRMAAYCREHGLRLRPHTKTHKTLEVSRMQLARGAVGLTVAKAGEAEVMAGAGPDEILVAYPLFGNDKLRRVAALARERRVFVSLDNELTAENLSRAATEAGVVFGVLVEFNSGLGRCGLEPGPACCALARRIMKLQGLAFRGLMTYPGNIWGTAEERKREAGHVAERIERAMEEFRRDGIAVEIVSGGSTPSAFLSHEIAGLTEIRPGTYVYNDANTLDQGACELADCAARVVATIVSTAVPGRAIIDAGSKTLSSDARRASRGIGYGYIVEAPDAPIVKLNEEHGYVDATRSSHQFRVGEVVTVIPNHVCTCVNMHDEVFVHRRGKVEGSWQVAARGKIR
jgi:D-serine deaminase-like pyridoxal phosphate-dependent protein